MQNYSYTIFSGIQQAGYTILQKNGHPVGYAVQAVCNSPPMSAAQGTTVYDRLLRLHLRHRSSAAPTVRLPPSAACAATPPFDVRSSGLFCGRPARRPGTRYRDPTCSVDSFRRDLKTLLFSFY